MKVINQKIIYRAIFILLTASWHVGIAHGDEAEAPATATPVAVKYFSAETISDKYELLLRYEPIHPGEKTQLTLFVSEYASNKPVNKAELKITAQEDSKLVFKSKQTGEGAYAIEGNFPDKKKYSLAISVNSPLGADLLLLTNIEPGKELPQAEAEQLPSVFGNWKTWLFVVLALIIGIGTGILLQKRNSKQGRGTIAILMLVINCLLPVAQTNAHGDDDHGAKTSGNNFSNSFNVPKETQFLFNVFTQKVAVGSFTESTKLFGNIIPASNGQAIVTIPQSGKIVALSVRVGDKVVAGQQLAVVEQNLDAVAQVGILSEKNTLAAEYEAAKKEFDRLATVQDIAAKRDVDEAKARLNRAENNLKAFTDNAGRRIILTAPIGGVVANFNLSIGATLNAGQTLFTITNLSQIYAEAQVFDKDAAKVSNGAKFTIECANDSHKTSDVKLLSVAQEINTTNQSQRVLFELTNPDGDFKIGEFVNIRVFAAANSQQIALPNSAITEINGKPVVFIKDAAEKYTLSYVQLGENNGAYTSILKGIEEGERVVINASYQLKMIYLNQ